MILVEGGRRHEVVLREGSQGQVAVVDGETVAFTLESVGPGTYLVRHGGRIDVLYCVREGSVVHVSWEGATCQLREEKEGRRAVTRPPAGGLETPMPGKVLKVFVAVGDVVTRGQEVLVVEAMKMENTLRAPRDGKVRVVAVQAGDRVTPGTLLVDLE